MTAELYRHCEGCARVVPLAEWQDGPLGCNDCRRHVLSVSIENGRKVIVEIADRGTAFAVFDRYTAALAVLHGIGIATDLAGEEKARAA